ncbi:MAG: hypothetical protein GKR89_01645 [Candidatus Latescibacteria bacterium]|nr:hypothetical protein [Candidatus Latescibacterota bacterium]
MSATRDLGRRVELVSMDPHFHDITIALYREDTDQGPTYRVHTYSSLPGADQRIECIYAGMERMGAMLRDGEVLRFACGSAHLMAARRLFLEVCKLAPEVPVETRPLTILDKKSGLSIAVADLGAGAYQVSGEGEAKRKERRIEAITGGLHKLAEMDPQDDSPYRAVFPCGQAHTALVGLLLNRALNVRQAMREQDDATGRGVLAAPSAQNE